MFPHQIGSDLLRHTELAFLFWRTYYNKRKPDKKTKITFEMNLKYPFQSHSYSWTEAFWLYIVHIVVYLIINGQKGPQANSVDIILLNDNQPLILQLDQAVYIMILVHNSILE